MICVKYGVAYQYLNKRYLKRMTFIRSLNLCMCFSFVLMLRIPKQPLNVFAIPVTALVTEHVTRDKSYNILIIINFRALNSICLSISPRYNTQRLRR